GFGGAAASLALANGLSDTRSLRELLARLELCGDEGPAGTGIVAMGSLPFNRDAPSRLVVPRYLITQGARGTWLTAADEGDWRRVIDDEAPALQEVQVARSVTYRPSPEEYAH